MYPRRSQAHLTLRPQGTRMVMVIAAVLLQKIKTIIELDNRRKAGPLV